MLRVLLALLLALVCASPAAWADTAPPCSTNIWVNTIFITSPTTQSNYPATMTNGGTMYFIVDVGATGGAQMALDYLVVYGRCQDSANLDPETGLCGGDGDAGYFTIPSSAVLGNGGTTTFSITVPNKTTSLNILSQPFGRCGATNGSSTLNKFFPGGSYENTWFNAVTW